MDYTVFYPTPLSEVDPQDGTRTKRNGSPGSR